MMEKKNINQKRGPRVGNMGRASKVEAFRANKSDRGSYLSSLADMVSNAFGRRGAQMKPGMPARDDEAALRSISPNTRVKSGPKKGNR